LWHKAGFKYDSSLGYPDVTGFRCGTCHPFKLYDISRDIELDVIEEPLIVMDGAIMELYVDDFKKAAEKIQSIALKCRSVDGIFSLLIHNSSLIHTRYHWRQFFYKTLSELF
jgi:hypothetical protein